MDTKLEIIEKSYAEALAEVDRVKNTFEPYQERAMMNLANAEKRLEELKTKLNNARNISEQPTRERDGSLAQLVEAQRPPGRPMSISKAGMNGWDSYEEWAIANDKFVRCSEHILGIDNDEICTVEQFLGGELPERFIEYWSRLTGQISPLAALGGSMETGE